MPEIKLVIFDCDGVLVDSEFLAARHESHRYGQHGFSLSLAEFSERFAGLTGEAISRQIEEELGRKLPDGLYRQIEGELDDILKRDIEAISGIFEALAHISQPRCVASNSGLQRLRIMLERTGLHRHFEPHVYSAKELDPPASKPKPDIFLHALKTFGIPPAQAVIIEDSVAGVTAARASGARVIGFTGGSHTYPAHAERLSAAGAETVISNHRLLPKTIEAFSVWDGLGAG